MAAPHFRHLLTAQSTAGGGRATFKASIKWGLTDELNPSRNSKSTLKSTSSLIDLSSSLPPPHHPPPPPPPPPTEKKQKEKLRAAPRKAGIGSGRFPQASAGFRNLEAVSATFSRFPQPGAGRRGGARGGRTRPGPNHIEIALKQDIEGEQRPRPYNYIFINEIQKKRTRPMEEAREEVGEGAGDS